MRHVLIGTSVLALLAGCASGPTTTFDQEVGSALNGNGFGNATMNNALVQSGARDYAVSLSLRFSETVPTTITFAFNSATLDGQAQAALNAQAAFIRSFPEVRFAVYGHTDLVGSNAYNYDLGLRRARAAVAYLVSRGVDGSRLQALVSEGETRPLVASQGPERSNRRTVTDVTGFVGSDPMVLNGKYAEIIFRDYVGSAGPSSTTTATAVGEVASTAPE